MKNVRTHWLLRSLFIVSLLVACREAIAQSSSGTCLPTPWPQPYVLFPQTMPPLAQATLIEVGDFNRDGRPDIVATFTDRSSYSLAILLRNADGSFGSTSASAAATGAGRGLPVSLTVGDFDGDGELDLATADGRTISVLLGNSDGTFKPEITTTAAPAFSVVQGIRIGDFNRDGRLDLAVAITDSSIRFPYADHQDPGKAIVTLLGNGDGTFRSGPTVDDITVQAIVVADFNHDGRSDIGAISATPDTGKLNVFLSRPDGTFSQSFVADFPHEWGGSYAQGNGAGSFVTADFNRDGNADLAVIDWPAVSTFRGDGHGSFAPAVVSAIDLLDTTTSIESQELPLTRARVADVDGDGVSDVVLVDSRNAQLVVVYGSGDGSFAGVRSYGPIDPDYGSVAIAISDFNGDGRSDVALETSTAVDELVPGNEVAAIPRPTVVAILASPDGGLAAPEQYRAGNSSVAVAADFNGDGISDFVSFMRATRWPTPFIRLVIFLSGPKHRFRASYLPDDFGPAQSLVAADFNDDGRSDLATISTDGTVHVGLGNGDGTFGPVRTYSVGQAGVIGAGDFNGDRVVDLAIISSAVIVVLLGNGDGTFGTPIPTTVQMSPNRDAVLIGDFDGDGKSDIAAAIPVAPPGSGVRVLLATGNGSFAAPVDYAFAFSPAGIAGGDLNGDGKDDLVVADKAGNQVWVLLANAKGGFSAPVSFPAGHRPATVAIADFDGDRRPDLAVGNWPDAIPVRGGFAHTPAAISILRGDGTGAFGNPTPSVDTLARMRMRTPGSLVVGDFDGDGRSDVATSAYPEYVDAPGPLMVLFNQCRFSSVQPAITAVQPARGPAAGGQMVTLSGRALAGIASLQIGGMPVAPSSNSAASIVFQTPLHPPRNVAVKVTTQDGQAVATYTYLAPPVATALSLRMGTIRGGENVVISGADLSEATVTFGGIAALITQNSNTAITVIVPAHAAGTVDVMITTPGGTATMSRAYQFVENLALVPTLSPQLLVLIAVVLAAVALRAIRM